MDRILIRGGVPLSGTVHVAGAKNAALPLMAASLLTDQTLTLANIPHLADITTLANLLSQHGVDMSLDGNAPNGGHTGRVLSLRAERITSTTAPYDLVRKMRASVLVLGPLLARCGRATVSLPGGCAIGSRPVDLHIKGMTQLGAGIEVDKGFIWAKAPGRLIGARIILPQVSVGATENILMAATLADGETILENAAREPEVSDLVVCLQAMGAQIEGVGSDTLRITGVDALHGAEHPVLPDRVEAGTYAIAAAITGGTLELEGARLEHLEALADVLRTAGTTVEARNGGVYVSRSNQELIGVDVMTEPFPGFPTDLQAQTMALLTTAKGASMVTETIFENRYMHVPELRRMGANINLHGASAMVRGVDKLTGAPVMASDLRASASLVLAGLAAEGETIVNRVYHLDRGYERLEQKLSDVGAQVERLEDRA